MKQHLLEITDNWNEITEGMERNIKKETKKEENVINNFNDIKNSNDINNPNDINNFNDINNSNVINNPNAINNPNTINNPNDSSDIYNSNDSSNSNNSNDSDNPSYETLIELKKKIHNLEKKILKEKKTQVQTNSEAYTKPLYRSFDEFYKYKKNYEEKEKKIKNETWKLLNKAQHIIENEKVETNKDNEKYSYTKLKSERKGTVKQLKEFFQKIEEEKREKRKNALFVKRVSNPANCFKRLDKEWSKTREVGIEKKFENSISETHLKASPVKCATIGEINGESRNGCHEISYNNKNIEIGDITISEGKVGEESDNEKNYDTKNKNNNDNMSVREIDILLGLIKDMKSNYETDKNHFSSLIKELENSSRYQIIEKLLDLLKLFEKTQKETSEKESSANNGYDNNNSFEHAEMLMHLTHYENKLKEIEMRIKNIESKKEDEAKEKKEENKEEKKEETEKVDRKEDVTEVEEQGGDAEIKEVMKREINCPIPMNKSNTTVQNQDNINDIDNASSGGICQNVGSNKLKNKNKKKNNNKKKAKHFDWFYKSVNFSEESLKTHNEKKMSNVEGGVESESDDGDNSDDIKTFNVNTNVKYYASDESEQINRNNELFSWLKEKDVESVISQKTEENT